MQKTKLALAVSTVVGLSALAGQNAMAGSATTDATADLVKDISVSANQPMQFGNLLNDLTAGAETVSFNTGGTALAAGTDVRHVSGSVQPAKFNLSTDTQVAADQSIKVSAAALQYTGTGTTASLPWRSLHADFATKSVSATQTTGSTPLVATITGASVPTTGEVLDAYGGIEVESADPAGTYSGTITVTANRE